jgi:type II secretory pathway predicted ATPase ExeA
MFEPFCGLSGHPFAPEPDPDFYFPSRTHQHAYRRLQYGLHHGGLTVLTGNPGTGKTTVLEAFLRRLEDSAVVARTLAQALDPAAGAGGKPRLLVLDDAHALPVEGWRELHRVALQTFLVGRPELRQRVKISCHLGPLERSETRRYVEHRLKHVGWKDEPPFDDEAFALIHACTGGIPRHINRLCARALTGIFVAEQGRIGAAALKRLIQAV